MKQFRVAAILLALAVILGAFGAHALKSRLSVEALSVWKTAVEYHFYHALGLMVISIASHTGILNDKSFQWISKMMLAGVLFFSGSLYLISTREIHGINVSFLGPITPIGGVFFIGGWMLAAFKANVRNVKE